MLTGSWCTEKQVWATDLKDKKEEEEKEEGEEEEKEASVEGVCIGKACSHGYALISSRECSAIVWCPRDGWSVHDAATPTPSSPELISFQPASVSMGDKESKVSTQHWTVAVPVPLIPSLVLC